MVQLSRLLLHKDQALLGAALADMLAANIEAVYARLPLVHDGIGDTNREVPKVLSFLVKGRGGLIQRALDVNICVLLLFEVRTSSRTECLIVGLHGPSEAS